VLVIFKLLFRIILPKLSKLVFATSGESASKLVHFFADTE